jgi:hypothetical protein
MSSGPTAPLAQLAEQLTLNQRATESIPEDYATSESCAAPGAAVEPEEASNNPDLQIVIEAWDSLPESTKIGILAMVRAADGATE